jgi:hypothetical protein
MNPPLVSLGRVISTSPIRRRWHANGLDSAAAAIAVLLALAASAPSTARAGTTENDDELPPSTEPAHAAEPADPNAKAATPPAATTATTAPAATPATATPKRKKSPWHLELDVGLPLVDTDSWIPNLSPTVTYETHRFDVGVSGGVDVSWLKTVPGGVRDVRGGGEIFASLRTGDEDDDVRLELGASFEAEIYNSVIGVKAPVRYTERSTTLRPTLSASLDADLSDRFELSFRAAVAAQREDFRSDNPSAGTYEASTTASFHGAVGGHYELVPEALTLRLDSQAWVFRLRRSEAIAGGKPSGDGIGTFTELEWETMAFADLDALAFWIFKPSLHVGLDETVLWGPSGKASGLTASLGVGLIER